MDADRCIMCGAIIPEGIMVCPLCDRKIEEMGKNHTPQAAAENAGILPGQGNKETRNFRLPGIGRKKAAADVAGKKLQQQEVRKDIKHYEESSHNSCSSRLAFRRLRLTQCDKEFLQSVYDKDMDAGARKRWRRFCMLFDGKNE